MARPTVKDADFVGREAYLRKRASAPAGDPVHADRRRPDVDERRQALHARPRADPGSRDGRPLVDAQGPPLLRDERRVRDRRVGKHLLMSYLPPDQAVEGTKLLVEYFGERYPVTVAVAGSDAAVRPGQRADPELTPRRWTSSSA